MKSSIRYGLFLAISAYGLGGGLSAADEIDSALPAIDQMISRFSQPLYGSDSPANAEIRTQVAKLQELKSQLKDVQYELGAVKGRITSLKSEQEVKMAAFKQRSAILQQDSEQFDREKASLAAAWKAWEPNDKRNKTFKLPDEQAAYNAAVAECNRLKSWDARINAWAARWNDTMRTYRDDLTKYTAEQAENDAVLQKQLSAQETRKEQVLAQCKTAIETLDRVSNEQAKQVLHQHVFSSPALQQAQAALDNNRRAMAAGSPEEVRKLSEDPYINQSRAQFRPGPVPTPSGQSIAPPAPTISYSPQVQAIRSQLQDLAKEREAAKEKLFSISNHPENFKDTAEQTRALQAAYEEQQVIKDKEITALGNLNARLAEGSTAPANH